MKLVSKNLIKGPVLQLTLKARVIEIKEMTPMAK